MAKLKDTSDLEELKRFAAEHNAIVLYGDEADLWYTLTCTSGSEMDALELANKAYESGKFAATDYSSSMIYTNGFILDHPDMPIVTYNSCSATSQSSPARQYLYNGNTYNNHGAGVASIIGADVNTSNTGYIPFAE